MQECNQLYYKCFAQDATWNYSKNCMLWFPPPQKILSLVTSAIIREQYACFDNSPLARLVSTCETFHAKPYCQSLTFLELIVPLTDSSGLIHCTQLEECVLHFADKQYVLPPSIRRLTVKGVYELPFPPQLTYLNWDCEQAVPIHQLPSSLTSLKTRNVAWNTTLPISLLSFTSEHYLGEGTLTTLPPKLTALNCYYHNINNHTRFFPFLPPSLTFLSIDGCFDCEPISFPPHLTELYFHGNAKVHSFPAYLKVVHFGEYFNQEIDHLPSGLTELTLGTCFNKDVNHLPTSLTTLIMNCKYYSEPIIHLPDSIRNMTITSCVLERICKWPLSLTRLHFKNVDLFPDMIAPIQEDATVIVSNCKQVKKECKWRIRCKQCLHQEHNCFYNKKECKWRMRCKQCLHQEHNCFYKKLF